MIRDTEEDCTCPDTDGVGIWPFDPSQKSEDFFSLLKARWGALESWGVRTKVPEAASFVKLWDSFRGAWEAGDEDTDDLQVQESNLNSAERFSESHGFKRPGASPGASQTQGDISAPELADRSAAKGVAVGIDEGAKVVEAGAKELAGTVGRGLVDVWNETPLGVKAGLGLFGIVTVGAIATTIAPRR